MKVKKFILEFYEKIRIEYGDDYLEHRRKFFKMSKKDWLEYCFSFESEF